MGLAAIFSTSRKQLSTLVPSFLTFSLLVPDPILRDMDRGWGLLFNQVSILLATSSTTALGPLYCIEHIVLRSKIHSKAYIFNNLIVFKSVIDMSPSPCIHQLDERQNLFFRLTFFSFLFVRSFSWTDFVSIYEQDLDIERSSSLFYTPILHS